MMPLKNQLFVPIYALLRSIAQRVDRKTQKRLDHSLEPGVRSAVMVYLRTDGADLGEPLIAHLHGRFGPLVTDHDFRRIIRKLTEEGAFRLPVTEVRFRPLKLVRK